MAAAGPGEAADGCDVLVIGYGPVGQTLIIMLAERGYRLGYPRDIVEFAVTTAGLGTGRAVLEVSCGTGRGHSSRYLMTRN